VAGCDSLPVFPPPSSLCAIEPWGQWRRWFSGVSAPSAAASMARGARLIGPDQQTSPLSIAAARLRRSPAFAFSGAAGRSRPWARCFEAGGNILVIQHAVNSFGDRSAGAVERSLEVNALSAWRAGGAVPLPAERPGRFSPAGSCG